MKKIISVILSTFLIFSLNFAQEDFSQTTSDAGMKIPEDRFRNSNEGFAFEEFRRGVQAYYRGAFNEAIVQFERSLSFLPNDNLILDWLGKSYYKSGLEGTALDYWQTISENNYGGLLLQNKIEIVRERRITGENESSKMRLTESGSFSGIFEDNLIFSGPVSVQPCFDGTMWIAAYNSNEIIRLNQNGKVLNRVRGPLNGFDRPSDIIRLIDENLLVCESSGDRLALLDKNGKFIKNIGEKGRQNGQMVGPVYLAQDYFERIYVTDYGNRRIDVFDKDGNAIFYFGGKSTNFNGLKGPTGIAVVNESVFVCDDQTGCIYEFDRNGNFIRELIEEKSLKKPEALKIWHNDLIVCDSNKVICVDINTGAFLEYANTGNAPTRVTCASPDINGNVIVSDFTANEIYVMSKMQELVGGLFVQIEQINSQNFPNITMEVKVENRHRQPIVGLTEENFFITENKRPVLNQKFLGAASNNDFSDITIIIDRSNESLQYKEEIELAVKSIASSMENGVLRIVTCSQVPVTEYIGNFDNFNDFKLESLKNPLSQKINLDLALRLSTNDLINSAKKRAIILITPCEKNTLLFDKYNLTELTAFMNNNSIGFSVVQVTQKSLSDELFYITENTSGNSYYVFRPQGLKSVVKDLIELPQGVYQLSFTSSLNKNYGTSFLPLETEVYIQNRSGRDETGYFAPLD